MSSAMTSLIDRLPSCESWTPASSWRSSGRSTVVRMTTSWHRRIMMVPASLGDGWLPRHTRPLVAGHPTYGSEADVTR